MRLAVAGHVEAQEQPFGDRQLVRGQRLAVEVQQRRAGVQLEHLGVVQATLAGHQANLVEREPGLHPDREGARHDLEVEPAVVARRDLVEAVAAVAQHAGEHVQAPGRALRVGLRADLGRQRQLARSAARGRGGRARAWRRRAGRSVRRRAPRSSPPPSSRCRAGSCSAAPTRAPRGAGRRSPAAPRRRGSATGRPPAIRRPGLAQLLGGKHPACAGPREWNLGRQACDGALAHERSLLVIGC